MNLPDCYEAYRQAEAIAAEHDRRRAAFPKCDICSRSLYDDDTYTKLRGYLICESCIDRNTHQTSDLISDIYD